MMPILVKIFGTVGLILTMMGTIVCGPCGPNLDLEVIWNDVNPPDGYSTPAQSVSIVVTGTEEKSFAVLYTLMPRLEKWIPSDAAWATVASPSWTQQAYVQLQCTEIRTDTLTFSNVPLSLGENKFRVVTQIVWDDSDGRAEIDEEYFTYTRTQ
jgi:hypothetical protein